MFARRSKSGLRCRMSNGRTTERQQLVHYIAHGTLTRFRVRTLVRFRVRTLARFRVRTFSRFRARPFRVIPGGSKHWRPYCFGQKLVSYYASMNNCVSSLYTQNSK